MEMYPDCHLAFKAHEDYVSDIQVVDGILITCSFDCSIRTWDPQTGELRHLMEGHVGGVRCMRLSGGVLFSGSEDCTVRSWNYHDGTPGISISGHDDWVNCLDLSTDVLFSGSSDSTIRAWNTETGDQVQSYVGHGSSVNCIQVVDKTIYSGSYDMTLRAFDVVSGECTMVMKGEYIGSIRCLLVHDGLVFAGSEEGMLRVLDPVSGECVRQLRGHTAHIKALRHGKPGQLISSSGDGVIRTWSTEGFQCESFFSNSNTCFFEDQGVFYVGSADGRVKSLSVDANMEETVERLSPQKTPPQTPPEPELALWEVVGAVDSVVKKTEETQEMCSSIPVLENKLSKVSEKLDQTVNELESLLGENKTAQSGVPLLRNLRMELRLLSDSVYTASEVSDLAHTAAMKGEMGEQTAQIISMLEARLNELHSDFHSPSKLPPWMSLANQELERALVLVEQSLERSVGSISQSHSEQVMEIAAQLKAEARARQQLEFATKQLEDDTEELIASNAEQFKDMEQGIQRLELYDRGVVFQKKIDDAIAECSREMEERLESDGQHNSAGLEQVSDRVDNTQDSLCALEKRLMLLWGTDTDGGSPSLVEASPHQGNVRGTSILGLQAQLDEAKAELAAFRSKTEGNLNQMTAANPAMISHVEDALETAKLHTTENVGQTNQKVNDLAAVVSTETEQLGNQVGSLRASCVDDLPDHWDEVKAVCTLARSMETELVPKVDTLEATVQNQGVALEETNNQLAEHIENSAGSSNKMDELEGAHSRFVAQQAKLQEHLSRDVERLWEKLREALVEPPELPRDLVYEADLTRLRQALEKRCNDVLVEASAKLTRSDSENLGVNEKLEALSQRLDLETNARQEAELELKTFKAEHAELKEQQDLTNQRVATLIQQVVEEQEARGCLEQVVNEMIAQCASILQGQRQVVSMVNSSNVAAARKSPGWNTGT